MILSSTTETVEFVAPWLEADLAAPRFMLRSGSVIERGAMEAELAGDHRAGRVYSFELADAIRSGVMALLADDPALDHVLSLVDAETQDEADDLSEDDKRLLTDTRNILAEHWPPYRDLAAQAARRREIAPIVALRRFCTGIIADGVEFKPGRDGLVSEETMAALDPLVMAVAGNRAYALQFPGGGLEKNSQPASQSDASQQGSRVADTSKEGGSSARKRGSKTRAS